MIEFIATTTLPTAGAWVILSLLYDKFYIKLFKNDESVYNPTNTGTKKPIVKEISKNDLKGITAIKKINLTSITPNEDETNAAHQDETKLEEIFTDVNYENVFDERIGHTITNITDLLTKDEIEELTEWEEIKTFKDETQSDVYGDTPTVSHIIYL
jgi:hypothetical protein